MKKVFELTFAESIRPAIKGQSDKYSWLLYQRAKNKGRESVFLSAWCPIYGKIRANLDDLKKPEHMPSYRIMLGRRHSDGWFNGNSLSTICRKGARRMDWAYGPDHGVRDWIDITEWFWTAYQRHGRCRFFRGVHEWTQINRNARKCAYCGKHERRTVVTRKVIEREEAWA